MEFSVVSFRRFAPATLALALVFTVTPASSSECKGVSQDDCATNAQCSWINEYVRSDGKKVNGYCRYRPKSKQGSDSEKQSSTTGKSGKQSG